MKLTAKEQRVVDVLREERVSTIDRLVRAASASRNVVFVALRKHGHFSSINCAGQYQALKETPRFGKDGLWFYDDVGFSRHGTLTETIKALVEMSPEGMTTGELEDRVKTRVHNQLSWLAREEQIRRFRVGRRAVYTSREEERRSEQRERREGHGSRGERSPVTWGTDQCFLPEGMDGLTVVRLLVQIIERPEASVASISKTLQGEGFDINAEKIRQVMSFYGVKKTVR